MILVVDVGTTGLRAAVVRPDGSIAAAEYRPFPAETPFPGLVEFDATRMATLVLDSVTAVLHRLGRPPVTAIGVADQRASTIVWDRATGRPVGPALGWQDLRTVGECLTANAEGGPPIAPNQSVTKIAWLLANAAADRDPTELCFGTVDTWIAWILSSGALHVTDHSNAAVTGLYSMHDRAWSPSICERFGIPLEMLPTIVDTSGEIGTADAIEGAPPIAALVGDQQASLVGQGCITPGRAKITFGTGGMLDLCTGATPPASTTRGEHGTFPIVAWSADGAATWGVEAIMLSAGSEVEWLVHDVRLIDDAADSHVVASSCDSTDGVVYVPAVLGLGTPQWDYGARSTLLGLTRGTGRPQVVRAVLEGVAHRGADLVDAAEADTGLSVPSLRIDGGMSRNPTFVQALADATARPVEVSPVADATTLGAAFHAGVATGVWSGLDEATSTWHPAQVVEPAGPSDRDRWRDAVARAQNWFPELSALDF